jgi:hypothetical protein
MWLRTNAEMDFVLFLATDGRTCGSGPYEIQLAVKIHTTRQTIV